MLADLGGHLLTLYLILQWVFFSSSIILFNKYILSSLHFPYPATLVLIHMLFASACMTAAKLAGWADIPALEFRQWRAQILPVGLCFAVSLALGNAAYLYITVAFVQMLKAATPIAVLLCSFAFGLEKPSVRLAVFIVLIAVGIASRQGVIRVPKRRSAAEADEPRPVGDGSGPDPPQSVEAQ